VPEYTEKHAKSGINADLPEIECWTNQYPHYVITIVIPEYTAMCPKTGLPDFGTITLRYEPDKLCLELKSLKSYINAYRDLGIFYENAVNRILKDIVAACKPLRATVTGVFNVRGGMQSTIEASYVPDKPDKPGPPSPQSVRV
jgi:7-cyano-7-deazaguanine reductase